ncbi:exported hypothetical protein [Candidatus Sulfopaludibacter sp. SbA4]|nr:exported hypothetical protein [Candidatus Sulfopaludibacter sp. SbA4]
MRFRFTPLILAAVAWPGFGQSVPTTVEIYVNSRDDSAQLLGPGTPMASGIFKKIGVRLNWHRGEAPLGQNAISLRTVEHAPESATPEAMAASQLNNSSGLEITVYKDRVRRFLDGHRSLARVALGYVLAHELAHVMQGLARHSEGGILKAHWSDRDFTDMVFHKLAFSAPDVELIHKGLALRPASGRPQPAIPVEDGNPAAPSLGKR